MKQACSLESMVDAVLSEMKRRGNAKNTIERHERAYSQFYEYHRYAGAVRYAELCEGYKAALLTETARSLRGAGQKADGQRAVGFCPFCRLCAGEAGDLLRKTERRKNFAKRGLTMEVRVL